jgi:hypothetical protein
MRFKVELHKDVVRFLKRECPVEAVAEFQRALERLRSDPIGLSEAVSDPKVSRYILRYFRFANYIALFEFDPHKDRIIVRICRKQRTGRQPDPKEP